VPCVQRDARLVLHEQEAATIRKAAELLVDEGRDLASAASTLNALGMLPRKAPRWYPDLLRQVMSERARMGEVIWGKPERISSRNGGTPFGPPTLIPDVPAVLPLNASGSCSRHCTADRQRPWPPHGPIPCPCG